MPAANAQQPSITDARSWGDEWLEGTCTAVLAVSKGRPQPIAVSSFTAREVGGGGRFGSGFPARFRQKEPIAGRRHGSCFLVRPGHRLARGHPGLGQDFGPVQVWALRRPCPLSRRSSRRTPRKKAALPGSLRHFHPSRRRIRTPSSGSSARIGQGFSPTACKRSSRLASVSKNGASRNGSAPASFQRIRPRPSSRIVACSGICSNSS